MRDIAGVDVETVGACFEVEPELVAAEVVFAADADGAGAADIIEKRLKATGGFD